MELSVGPGVTSDVTRDHLEKRQVSGTLARLEMLKLQRMISLLGYKGKGQTKCCPSGEQAKADEVKVMSSGRQGEFVSPLKALAFNFRFNQMTGIFPTRISSDFMTITFEPLLFVWTAVVKIMLWSLILLVMYVWLDEQGFTFGDLLSRAMSSDRFTNTDYFAIIAHYIFLQVAAYFLFFNNLTLCSHLTKLNFVLKQLSMSTATTGEKMLANPSAKCMMIYRVSVCIMCTVASIIYLSGVHSIVRNPEVTVYDYVMLGLIVGILYIENQNHMFSELLFLRFLNVLKHHCTHFLDHARAVHPTGYRNRQCCFSRAGILREMYDAISVSFGNDLFVTIVILVISIVFGFYLLTTFTIFVKGPTMWPFLIAYFLYAVIPSIRVYVLVEGSERIRRQIREIKIELNNLECGMICSGESLDADLASLRRVMRMFENNPGFSASGYFNLSRGIITSLVGSLFTYLIVLLQFKAADLV